MIATLAMYKRPELEQAHAEYWQAIRLMLAQAGIAAPEQLSQEMAEEKPWLSPDLIFSQTCGMPYRLMLHDKVTLIGTPDYGIEGCPPGYYKSAIVVHQNDKRQNLKDYKHALFAYNNDISQSGYAAAFTDTKKHGFFFKSKVCSGSHLKSAMMVAMGSADIAYIDALSLKFVDEYEEFYDELRILGWTDPVPGLPYITAFGADQRLWFDVVSAAIAALPKTTRSKLHLKGLTYIPAEKYLAVPNPS